MLCHDDTTTRQTTGKLVLVRRVVVAFNWSTSRVCAVQAGLVKAKTPHAPSLRVRLPARALAFAALLAAPALAGCVLPWDDAGDGGDGGSPWWGDVPRANDSDERPRVTVTFGGRVLDAATGDPTVDEAQVRLDLASEAPCRRESLLWRDWLIPLRDDGTFGPFDVPAPDSPSYRFFVHVNAPGYTEEVAYVGPREAVAAGNLTFVLHPRVAVEGIAPPGTVVALAGGDFPRFTVSSANGTFAFEDARTSPTQLLAATHVPHREALTPPAFVNATTQPANASAWGLQGVVKREDGRPIAAEVVAWNGALLWSAARTDEVGRFLLPLPAERAELRIEARTSDDQYGGILARTIQGPPAAVETVIVRGRC